MAARGKKSTAELSIVRLQTNTTPRISPRSEAPAEVRALFAEIVASCPPTHWRPSDTYLVESLAQAILTERAAYQNIALESAVVGARVSQWISVAATSCKQIALLSTKLRLTPQSRSDPKTVGRRSRNAGMPKPWEPEPLGAPDDH
jgi:hypothetical protein